MVLFARAKDDDELITNDVFLPLLKLLPTTDDMWPKSKTTTPPSHSAQYQCLQAARTLQEFVSNHVQKHEDVKLPEFLYLCLCKRYDDPDIELFPDVVGDTVKAATTHELHLPLDTTSFLFAVDFRSSHEKLAIRIFACLYVASMNANTEPRLALGMLELYSSVRKRKQRENDFLHCARVWLSCAGSLAIALHPEPPNSPLRIALCKLLAEHKLIVLLKEACASPENTIPSGVSVCSITIGLFRTPRVSEVGQNTSTSGKRQSTFTTCTYGPINEAVVSCVEAILYWIDNGALERQITKNVTQDVKSRTQKSWSNRYRCLSYAALAMMKVSQSTVL